MTESNISGKIDEALVKNFEKKLDMDRHDERFSYEVAQDLANEADVDKTRIKEGLGPYGSEIKIDKGKKNIPPEPRSISPSAPTRKPPLPVDQIVLKGALDD